MLDEVEKTGREQTQRLLLEDLDVTLKVTGEPFSLPSPASS
jgi:hypothetical protein